MNLIYINFEIKKNHINTIAFNPKMIPINIYANFFPINAVSGSSFTLIEFSNYCKELNNISKISFVIKLITFICLLLLDFFSNCIFSFLE